MVIFTRTGMNKWLSEQFMLTKPEFLFQLEYTCVIPICRHLMRLSESPISGNVSTHDVPQTSLLVDEFHVMKFPYSIPCC